MCRFLLGHPNSSLLSLQLEALGPESVAFTQLFILMTNILIHLSRSGQEIRPTLLNFEIRSISTPKF